MKYFACSHGAIFLWNNFRLKLTERLEQLMLNIVINPSYFRGNFSAIIQFSVSFRGYCYYCQSDSTFVVKTPVLVMLVFFSFFCPFSVVRRLFFRFCCCKGIITVFRKLPEIIQWSFKGESIKRNLNRSWQTFNDPNPKIQIPFEKQEVNPGIKISFVYLC